MTETIVTTQAGKVRGALVDGVVRFRGVPYAASPLGDRRFKAPEPHASWSDIRDFTGQGPTAPLKMRMIDVLDITPLVGTGWVKGDDFLTAAIWTPDPKAEKLPVMVFIHGGAWVGGCNDAPAQDGTAFAKSGVVYIALNYRLGIEGFLPMPGAPTNLGLRDQIAGLKWVKDNVAAFGGDPANITVFGESAGAMSIADIVTSPLAKGLFQRAIIESGHGSMVRSIPVAQRLTHKLARMLKITPDVDGFRSRTVEQCLDVAEKIGLPTARIDLREANRREPAYGLGRFLPVYGDDVLPVPPLEALANGAAGNVDILIGTNSEEMNLYFVPTGVTRKIPGLLAIFLLSRSEPRARRMLKAYGLGRKGVRAGEALTLAMSDLVFRLPARTFAAQHKGMTHFYEFDWRSSAFGGELGACHGIELPFVFDTLDSCTGPKGLAGIDPPRDLARRVHNIWVDFAKGEPLPWAPYTAGTRQVLMLESGEVRTDPVMPADAYWS